MQYTKDDTGCWIDGAYGHEHAHSKITSMTGIESECNEDWCDLDDMTDTLYTLTEADLYWIWDAGDLILTTESELD